MRSVIGSRCGLIARIGYNVLAIIFVLIGSGGVMPPWGGAMLPQHRASGGDESRFPSRLGRQRLTAQKIQGRAFIEFMIQNSCNN